MGEMIMEGERRGAVNGRKSFRRCTHFNVSFLLQIILGGREEGGKHVLCSANQLRSEAAIVLSSTAFVSAVGGESTERNKPMAASLLVQI